MTASSTGHRAPCGNACAREEELVRQFGEILKQIRIPHELAGTLATVLRESQADKEKFVRTSMLRLQQQQMLLRSRLDRVYADHLSDAISEELWTTKSAELQEEVRRVRVVSNSTIDRGSLSPTYIKPFDAFANGAKLELGSPHWTISATG